MYNFKIYIGELYHFTLVNFTYKQKASLLLSSHDTVLKILNEHGSNRNLLEQLQYSLLLLPYDDCGLPTCLLINGRYTVVELHSLEITSVVTLSSTRTEWYIINNVKCQKESNSFSCHFSKLFKYMTSINLQWNPTFGSFTF